MILFCFFPFEQTSKTLDSCRLFWWLLIVEKGKHSFSNRAVVKWFLPKSCVFLCLLSRLNGNQSKITLSVDKTKHWNQRKFPLCSTFFDNFSIWNRTGTIERTRQDQQDWFRIDFDYQPTNPLPLFLPVNIVFWWISIILVNKTTTIEHRTKVKSPEDLLAVSFRLEQKCVVVFVPEAICWSACWRALVYNRFASTPSWPPINQSIKPQWIEFCTITLLRLWTPWRGFSYQTKQPYPPCSQWIFKCSVCARQSFIFGLFSCLWFGVLFSALE